MRLVIRHELDCPPETFYSEQVLFHPDFLNQLNHELGLLSWQQLSLDEQGSRRQEVRLKRPAGQLPPAVRRALKVDHLEYREQTEFNRDELSYRFEVVPNVLPDRISISGCYLTEPLGADRCVRTVQMTIEVRLLGIGRSIERRLADDLRRSYDHAAAFTNRWLAKRGPARTASPDLQPGARAPAHCGDGPRCSET